AVVDRSQIGRSELHASELGHPAGLNFKVNGCNTLLPPLLLDRHDHRLPIGLRAGPRFIDELTFAEPRRQLDPGLLRGADREDAALDLYRPVGFPAERGFTVENEQPAVGDLLRG